MSNSDAREHLRELVDALDDAFISTWQSTAAWQKQLDAAREFLNRDDAPGVARHREGTAIGVKAHPQPLKGAAFREWQQHPLYPKGSTDAAALANFDAGYRRGVEDAPGVGGTGWRDGAGERY